MFKVLMHFISLHYEANLLFTPHDIEKTRTVITFIVSGVLQNVVFLIASGSRNLGGTCARNVVERGGKVVLCDSVSMKDAGEELQQSLGQKDFMFVPTDVSLTISTLIYKYNTVMINIHNISTDRTNPFLILVLQFKLTSTEHLQKSF